MEFQYKDDRANPFAASINDIYAHIADDESRQIFHNRLMFSLTDDSRFMRDIILNTDEGRALYNSINSRKGRIYIYGAGMRGKRLVKLFPEISWSGFIDQKQSGECFGFPINKLADMDFNASDTVVISMYSGWDDVRNTLLELGLNAEQIVLLGEFDKKIAENMYFDSCIKPALTFDKYFVDAGAYDGKDTMKYKIIGGGAPSYPNRTKKIFGGALKIYQVIRT